jgi:hypothetical protein
VATQPSASAGGANPAPGGRTITPAPIPVVPAPPVSSTVSGGSEVYRIGTDNYPQRVWTHSQDVVYAITFDAAGRAVLGTGNRGNIHRIDSELNSTLLINASPTQVTALTAGPKGTVFAATGNVGKVYQVGPALEKQGTFESEPLDVSYFSYWGRVRHKGDANGGAVRFETRSGNLDRPQKNWSPWAPLDASSRVASPSARFLQYRLTLESAGDAGSPAVREIEIAYMAKNVPPVIEEIDITPANYKFPATPALSSTTSQSLTLPPLSGRNRQTSSAQIKLDAGSSSSQTVQYDKGSAGARWAVSDANGDEMAYQVEIRGVGERDWKLLKDKVNEKHLTWDSTAYPDGEYVLRVTASDLPANPPDQALTAQLESERFTIDNTPPEIAGLTGARTGGKLNVKWRARDARSVVSLAEYSVNGGEWVVVNPSTRLSDAPELDYSLALDAPAGEATIAVRVTDELDNQSVQKVVVR